MQLKVGKMKKPEEPAHDRRNVRDRERRLSPRFRVTLPVTFESTTGWTRDLSAAGVFFTFDERLARPPDVGAQIRLGLVLENADPRGAVAVRCAGSVVRLDRTGDAVGVAVQFDSYEFDPTDDPARSSRS